MNQKTPWRIGLYVDRPDWILGTIASQTMQLHGGTGRFSFYMSSWSQIMRAPISEIKSLQSCDLIHWITYDYLDLLALFPSVRHICTIHHVMDNDDILPDKFKDFTLLTVSQNSRKKMEERGFVNIEIVRNGVDPDLFVPMDAIKCREHLAMSSSRPLVGFFGKGSSNPMDRKGTEVLIEALKRVNRQVPVALLLSGKGWDALERNLTTDGIEVFYRPVKSINEMPWLYGAIDVYVCTSWVEGGPVPVLEAMSCGRPVISTPVGHVPEVARDGENSLLVPIYGAQATAAAIIKVLKDSSLARQLGSSARETIIKGWTWEAVLAPLGKIYEQVMLVPGDKKSSKGVMKTWARTLARSFYHRFYTRKV
jgi:glycosyltransferase involved in cell wall biosynthesis